MTQDRNILDIENGTKIRRIDTGTDKHGKEYGFRKAAKEEVFISMCMALLLALIQAAVLVNVSSRCIVASVQ